MWAIQVVTSQRQLSLCCLAMAPQREQTCDRSTVYVQEVDSEQPVLSMPMDRVLVPPRYRPPQSSVELREQRIRPSRLGDPIAGDSSHYYTDECAFFRDTTRIGLYELICMCQSRSMGTNALASFDTPHRSQQLTTPGRTSDDSETLSPRAILETFVTQSHIQCL